MYGKYIGKWGANNSSYGTITGNNLAQLKKELCSIVKGNVFIDNRGGYSITSKDGDYIVSKTYRMGQWQNIQQYNIT